MRAIDSLEASLGPDAPPLASALHNLAEVKIAKGDCPGATPLLERTADLIAQSTGPDSFNMSFPLLALGTCQQREGKTAAAVATLERAVALRDGAGHGPAAVAEARFALAKARWRHRERRQAIRDARTAREELAGTEGTADERAEVSRWLHRHRRRGRRR
jgi:hypothetical protein